MAGLIIFVIQPTGLYWTPVYFCTTRIHVITMSQSYHQSIERSTLIVFFYVCFKSLCEHCFHIWHPCANCFLLGWMAERAWNEMSAVSCNWHNLLPPQVSDSENFCLNPQRLMNQPSHSRHRSTFKPADPVRIRISLALCKRILKSWRGIIIDFEIF